MSSPPPGAVGADNSVRLAGERDLPAVGAIHARSWTGPYADVLPPALVAALTPEVLASAWAGAVLAPPTPRHRVHVALGDGLVTGFAASAPAPQEPDREDGDAPAAVELVALEVDPGHQRRGHGSRLLAAVVDTAAADGVEQLQVWVHVDDAARAGFLRGAGFAEDGARRRRALAGGDPDDARSVWPEVRLVAWLGGDPTA